MPSDRSRREALKFGGTALTAVLAGCPALGSSETPTSTPTPGPDAGRDSYGIRIENETRRSRRVSVRVTEAFGDATPLEETVSVGGDKTHSWNTVMTKDVEYAIVARLPSVTVMDDALEGVPNKYSTFVEVGSGEEPPAADLIVTVEMVTITLSGADKQEAEVPGVRIHWPARYRTTTTSGSGG